MRGQAGLTAPQQSTQVRNESNNVKFYVGDDATGGFVE